MLTLSDAQWEDLQQRDAKQFVVAVCDQFLVNRPEMLQQPGRQVVGKRMQAAHDYARQAGFSSTPHVVRLMYLAADAPAIHDDPHVSAYLGKKGATPEQRLDDLLAVVSKKIERDD